MATLSGLGKSPQRYYPSCIVIGNTENRRIAMFQDALRECHCLPAVEVSYEEVLQFMCERKPYPWPSVLGRCENTQVVVRLESPGENFDVERRLIAVGAHDFLPVVENCVQSAGAATRPSAPVGQCGGLGAPKQTDLSQFFALHTSSGPHSSSLSMAQSLALPQEHGRILHPAQGHRGFARLVRAIAHSLAIAAKQLGIHLSFMNDPEEILCLFDKAKVNTLLKAHGIAVPPLCFANTACYSDLRESLLREGASRVFVKLAHGSSASGVVALECMRTRRGEVKERATTSMERVREAGEGPDSFFNSLRVRRYTDSHDIGCIIDYLYGQGLTIERWIPKALHAGVPCDIRVLVIDGEPCHWVIRMGTSGPMTNLHLGNQRGDANVFLKEECPPETWATVLSTCRAVARVFPKCLHLGVDVLITSDFSDVVVLEINAFGDLLPRILHRGVSTYTAEVQAMLCEFEARHDVHVSKQAAAQGMEVE